MDIQDLYLPQTVANLAAGAFCTVTAVATGNPWVAVIGLTLTFGAVGFTIIVGELTDGSRESRPWPQAWRRSQAGAHEPTCGCASSTSGRRSK